MDMSTKDFVAKVFASFRGPFLNAGEKEREKVEGRDQDQNQDTFEDRNSSASFNFKLHNVTLSDWGAKGLKTAQYCLDDRIGDKKFEDFSHKKCKEQQFASYYGNAFMDAIHCAWAGHFNLTLSVSDFILVISQGLSKHINANPEKFRRYFVDHDGKKTLAVRMDSLVLGGDNEWGAVFEPFANQIKNNTKSDLYDIVVDDTSVATKTSKIVSQITLMDAVKKYFDYRVFTCSCGIPEVVLKGAPEDWEKLRNKVRMLNKLNTANNLNLDSWLNAASPIIEKVCDTGSLGEVDIHFWKDIYKEVIHVKKHVYDRGNYPTGWCLKLFPNQAYSGASSCNVPFVWEYRKGLEPQEIPMTFHGGFLGAKFNQKEMSFQPEQFWAVSYGTSE